MLPKECKLGLHMQNGTNDIERLNPYIILILKLPKLNGDNQNYQSHPTLDISGPITLSKQALVDRQLLFAISETEIFRF